ncbi:DUF2000 domain-containing protein [Streptomyces sp. A7024]|uniref:DUF2000 domain-containing protein n=1 Tax=Streptomyces coryli TaxID=1128680 RepID=A0A6G4UE04_9ACTN|nr:DUF2000 domain-containing protein [Streptomyces coryli]NGN69618.1 DUF2000 domain-containing protein [Streptomyces coryli]
MRFDTKFAIVVRDDLATWQKLNVTAFLATGVAHATDTVMGEKPYEDADGNAYLALAREPVLVYAADAAELQRTRERALKRGLHTGIYTEEIFATDNDDDNRAAVKPVPAAELNLVGLALYGPRNQVDRTTKGLKLHA